MSDPRVTVVVVPRDSFAQTQRCLDRLLACTPAPRRVVVVDGGSPTPIATLLANAAVEHDFTLVRSDHLLTPNEARNVGLAEVTTTLVAFVDTDVDADDHWLDALLPHFNDPRVALAAPRVMSTEGATLIAEYEAVRSPLDVGSQAGRIAAGSDP